MKKVNLLLLLFSFLVCFGQSSKPKFERNIEGIKEYSLGNGMQVLLIQDNSKNNMVVNIVYNVGSRHEGYGEKGMAHLLEHMLFKSTKNLGDIKKQLTEKGGNANGTTWYDRTNYYEIFPSSDENLEWSLMMEADRMLNATILQSDLDKEFSVVRNEFEIGENDPSGVLLERVLSTSYLWHNYGQSTIGSKEDIERVKAETLRVFYEKYYQPNNATLIVAGKFDENKALEYIEKYFGHLPAKEIKGKTYTVEPAQDGEKYVELKRSGDVYNIGVSYHGTAYANKDYAALDAMVEILTSEPSGYLYKALVEQQKASSMWAFQPTTRDPGFLYFNVEVPKDKDIKDAKSTLIKELDGVASMNFTQTDLDRAKAKLIKQIENIQNNTIGLAISLTEIVGAGDYRLGFLYRDNVEALTLADIQRVAKDYFRANNRTVGLFIPTDNEERLHPKEISDDEIFALTKDYKGRKIEEEDLSFEPTITNVKNHLSEGTISSGMKYAYLDKPIKGKKVEARFVFPVASANDLKGKSTIADLMASMLKSGTKDKSREELQDELDKMKSSVRFGWSGQKLFVNISTYQEYLPKVMELVNSCLTESSFPENELEKIKLESKASIEASLKDPQSIAFDKIGQYKQPYAKDHIFYNPTSEETLALESKVTRQQIVDFYNKFIGTNNGLGTIVGKLDKNQVKSLLESTFGSIKSNVAYNKETPQYYTFKGNTERVITPDKENAVAGGIYKFELKESDKDFPAMEMINYMLGGGFITARIPHRLRETEGISYGAGSFINVPISHQSASMGVYAFFNPDKVNEVEKGLKEELQKASTGNFTQEELNSAKTSWENSRQTWFTNDGQLINLINNQLEFGQNIQTFETLGKNVKNLSLSEVNKIAKKYIKPENLYMVLAGDFK